MDRRPIRQPSVAGFMAALTARVSVPVVGGDERLTSREAESRLAVGERDWRRRKKKLDAAAAAIILQDYLDHQGSGRPKARPTVTVGDGLQTVPR